MKKIFRTDEVEIMEGEVIRVARPIMNSSDQVKKTRSGKKIRCGKVFQGRLKHTDSDGWYVFDGIVKFHIDEDTPILE